MKSMNADLDYIRGNADQLLVVSTYTEGSAYEAIVANIVCAIAVTAEDLPIDREETDGRRITVASKVGTACTGSPSTQDLRFVLINSSAEEILAVVSEATNQTVIGGNQIQTSVWHVNETD